MVFRPFGGKEDKKEQVVPVQQVKEELYTPQPLVAPPQPVQKRIIYKVVKMIGETEVDNNTVIRWLLSEE